MDETPPPSWMLDAERPERLRYWNGDRWTEHVSIGGVQSVDPLDAYEGQRWQYAVVNIGMFGAVERMQLVLGSAGWQGWERVATYDKASNWFNGLEKGLMLLKRPVPSTERLNDEQWCLTMNLTQ